MTIVRIISRADLFRDFCKQNQTQRIGTLIMIFKSTSNEDLAEMFNLRVFRNGYFN